MFDQDDGSGAGLMKDLPQLLAPVDPQRTTRNERVERERKREGGWCRVNENKQVLYKETFRNWWSCS